MKNLKVGDVIKLKKEHSKHISDSFNFANNIEREIDSMCQRVSEIKKKTWEFVYETNPDLKNYVLSHNMEDGTLIIINKIGEK